MEIKTAFNPGDKVWVIHEGKAKQLSIRTIKIELNSKDSVFNAIIVENYVNIGTETEYKAKIFEDYLCFSTREELINSL